MEKYRGYIILIVLLATFMMIVLFIKFIDNKDSESSEAPSLSYHKKISYIKTNEMFMSINDAINKTIIKAVCIVSSLKFLYEKQFILTRNSYFCKCFNL